MKNILLSLLIFMVLLSSCTQNPTAPLDQPAAQIIPDYEAIVKGIYKDNDDNLYRINVTNIVASATDGPEIIPGELIVFKLDPMELMEDIKYVFYLSYRPRILGGIYCIWLIDTQEIPGE